MVGASADPGTPAAPVRHVTEATAALLGVLPGWVRLHRAANPGPMTLDGTNSWVLRAPGADACVIVDPGPLEEQHLAALVAQAPVAAVLITHGHLDHVEGVPRLLELLGDVPVVAAGPDGPLQTATLAEHGLRVSTLATPGHTADSICFVAEVDDERVVFTGDTILGRGTTVVAFPDGDLGDYLDSLAALERLGPLPVLPGHGPALADCAVAAAFYRRHRLARLEQVRQARTAGAETPAQVVAAVYADVDRVLWPAAELSVRAQLAYLDARQDGARGSGDENDARQSRGESGGPPPRLDRP